jgi:hypothetical protein
MNLTDNFFFKRDIFEGIGSGTVGEIGGRDSGNLVNPFMRVTN